MACIDILSQLNPVDDPFAGWFKFDDNADPLLSLHNHNHINSDNDVYDIFQQIYGDQNDEKCIAPNQNLPDLLDFKNVPSNISSYLSKSNKTKLSLKQTQKSVSPLRNALQLNIIGINNNTSSNSVHKLITNLTLHNKVYDLKAFIKEKYKLNDNIGLLMIYGHSVLLNEQNTLQSYGLCNNASIFIAFCEDIFKFNSFLVSRDPILSSAADDFATTFNSLGDEYEQFEEKQTQILNELQKLIGFSCTKMKDLDILTYSVDTNCIAMPCGHGMPYHTLYCYVESVLNDNKVFVKCPHICDDDAKCNKIWYYPIIRYILMESKQYTAEQMMKLDVLSSWNTFKSYYTISECSNCQHNVYRHCYDDKRRKKSFCPLCKNVFCWKCHGVWIDKTSDECCGNDGCNCFEKEYMEILSGCPLKKIGSVDDVPSIRSCPNCSQLIHHTECCKHMPCPRCKTAFCFVCLRLYDTVGGSWQCGSSGSKCPVAPKQIVNIKANKAQSKVSISDVSEWDGWF